MAGDQPDQPSLPLTSWKAIARFFDRDVRTVQRWEKEEGLPVRRHLHQRKSTVYAEPAELRAWWSGRSDLNTDAAPQPVAPTGADGLERSLGKPLRMAAVGGLGLLVVLAALWTVVAARKDKVPGINRVRTISGRPPDTAPMVGPAGDFNGDGLQDLIVSTTEGGRAYIVFGGAHRVEGAIDAFADVRLEVAQRHGIWPTQAGDFNGDGIDDLLISELLSADEALGATGPSYVLWGRRMWPRSMTVAAAADVTLQVEWPTNAGVTGCITGRGADLNGDGLDDIVLGGVDYGPPDRRSAGVLLILFGRPGWPRTLAAVADADVMIDGAEAGEAFGGQCATGDVDGDGAADLAVMAVEHTLFDLRRSRGRVYLFSGRPAWPRRLDARTDSDFRVDGVKPNRRPSRLHVADITADGLADLIVSRTFYDAAPFPGEVRVFVGGLRRGVLTDDSADVVIEQPLSDARFGQTVSTSDLDGDGLLDLVVSEPGSGTLYAFYGRREWRKHGTPADHQGIRVLTDQPGVGNGPIVVWPVDPHGPATLVLAPDVRIDRVRRDLAAWMLETFQPVKLDIRPGYDENLVLPNWTCVVRVAGFSRDAGATIEGASLRLAGVAPTQFVTDDYNGDGIPDVQASFDTTKMRLDGQTQQLWIRGRTRDGQPIAGTDSVIVKSKRGR